MGKHKITFAVAMLSLLATIPTALAQSVPVPVTTDNFIRAESDAELAKVVKSNGFGKFFHNREIAPVDQQIVVRVNRDTLYSSAVFDLDAGPVTITLPDAGKRFRSMIVINQNHYAQEVVYNPGRYTLDRKQIGTRYVLATVRTLVNPADPGDLAKAHALQDDTRIEQKTLEVSTCPTGTRQAKRKSATRFWCLGPLSLARANRLAVRVTLIRSTISSVQQLYGAEIRIKMLSISPGLLQEMTVRRSIRSTLTEAYRLLVSGR
ncbi:DUF1254 domain-containing protein [Paraburkholderia caledonica]|uniref:DUF1254 domain-containing protein n=1 Tax=Paraburkholderia caledonica TaxID=134536 RepID=UPI00211B344E|nr:DUF1254 domain-containing protein [Paraburkholderia caledonica]